MKKLATLVFALLLTGTLSFAQAGSTTTKSDDTSKSDKKEKSKKAKKSKKSKKGGSTDSTSTPK